MECVRRMLRGLRGPGDTTWFISSRQNDSYEVTIIAARATAFANWLSSHCSRSPTPERSADWRRSEWARRASETRFRHRCPRERRAQALQPDGRPDWTWDPRGTAFNGGRLDNLIYSSGPLEVAHATVWDAELMSADTLSAHGLTPETSKTINRRRPVVVDLRHR